MVAKPIEKVAQPNRKIAKTIEKVAQLTPSAHLNRSWSYL